MLAPVRHRRRWTGAIQISSVRQTDFEGDGERVWWLSGRCSTRFPQYAHFLTKSSWLAVGCRTEGEFLGIGPTAGIIKTSHEDESSHRKDAPDMSTSTTLGSIRCRSFRLQKRAKSALARRMEVNGQQIKRFTVRLSRNLDVGL